MLVLSRLPGQRIVIDGRIVVTFIDSKGGKARLGFEAPLEVGIRREEIPDQPERRMRRREGGGG
jgi:carbon storage regulator